MEVLQTKDVAQRLSCSRELVRLLAREGQLPSQVTPSGTRFYRSDDVERLRKQREEKRKQKQA